IISSLPRWLLHTRAQIVIPSVWERFLPHLVSDIITDHLNIQVSDRLIPLPDHGGRLSLSDSEIIVLPAHFLHSIGNFSFYDVHARILFSGDIGSSAANQSSGFVSDFEAHTAAMAPFHQRYMCSNLAARYWVAMVRRLDVNMIIPQHGPGFSDPVMIEKFLSWLELLPTGLDVLDPNLYQIPKKTDDNFR
ncbi:MAG: FprA family A-type flavoprotein, partial [Pseudomonadales bacterium]|nr:FprA family A-type flavoprotein [Pseudomonadales bacterium]